ncbi:hypothetical protein [Xenophilus sp. Marseille-Q4582]|uniref:hypothetical protein n=1 Tax=Xenophilus sp. Marseille-Q4582 TaxID=2866600 RepID=UPI001CE41252|nr:hypothetical protein [Xenophilus sp. Marseille-Q4582]
MTQQNIPVVPDHWPSESALIADLLATFPGIHARPAREYGSERCQHGVWVGGEALMPDEVPMFCTFACPDPDYYDGYVHHAFIEWLAQRGWLIEEYDTAVFMVTSQAQADEEDAQQDELEDLLDQRHEACIVLHRLEAAVAACRLKISRWDEAATAQCLEEIEHHKKRLADMLQTRRIVKRDGPGDEAPF